ncbi:MAG: DNA-processing protein DprA [Chlamydiota bacterium]
MKEVEALTILSGAPLIGPMKVRLLVETFGSALEALDAGVGAWRQLSGFGDKVLAACKCWLESDRWLQNFNLVEKCGVKLVPFTSPDYPERLAKIPDAPIILYVKGDVSILKTDSLAVIGTRMASIYGLESAAQISEDLAALGYTVVSGLARGIDTKAHQGAIRSGHTIAVIGSGLGNVYPRENSNLALDICDHGALVSEYPMTTPPDRQNFPQRNRIVSGLSLGTVLIEAPQRSGAMLTMNKAIDQGRPVFALPGRVDSTSFQGNLSLLKSQKAHLIENARDIHQILKPEAPLLGGSKRKQAIVVDDEESQFLALLPKEELSFEKIVEISNLPVMKINVLLMSLLLKCAIKEYPGKIYKKLV